MQLRLLEDDQVSGLGQKAEHNYGEDLANTNADRGEIYRLFAVDRSYLQPDTKSAPIFQQCLCGQAKPIEPRINF